jgi:hypothetical protein
MEELTQFFIHTPWRMAHRWDIGDDGLIEYGNNRITPREVYNNFIIDYPMFKILRAEVSTRIERVSNTGHPYSWVTVERFDK